MRPICTLSIYAPKQWSNKTNRNSIGYFTANNRQTRAHDPKNVGAFLYYARAVDCTMLPALNTLVEQQSSPTKNTESAITHFLDYAATNPSAIIHYKASNMIPHIYSDASYLPEPRTHSRTVGELLPQFTTNRSEIISKPPATSKLPNPHGIQNPQARGGVPTSH